MTGSKRFEVTIQFDDKGKEIHTDFLDTLATARAEVDYWRKHYGPLPGASIWDHVEKAYRALEKPDPARSAVD